MGMNLRPFGRTGLMISPLTLGTMEFGSKVDETEASPAARERRRRRC